MSKTESDATRAWPRLRATLRIARRDAARSKGRALLVILMIGLPVMAVTAGATLVESSVLTPARMADQAIGVEGQARITWTGLTSLQQAPHEQMWAAEDAGPDLSLTDVEAGLTERLPAGAVLERMFTEADAAQATSGEGSEDLSMPGEAEPDWRWTVKAAEVPWATVLEINDFGGLVLSRAVILDPPADADVPYFQSAYSPTPDTGPNATLVMAIALAVFVGAEVILIIGPAFAIGARRTERQLALIAASGGDRRTLSQVVLLGGWFMGAVAAVGGVAAGLFLALLIRWIVRLKSPASMPDLQIPVWLILAIGVTGTVLAAAASWLPARRAAKVDVVAALSGRSKTPKPGGSAPVWAAALIIVGTGLAAFGAIKQVPAAMAGIALIMVGLVLGTGEIVAVVGRLAPPHGTGHPVLVAGRQPAPDPDRTRDRRRHGRGRRNRGGERLHRIGIRTRHRDPPAAGKPRLGHRLVREPLDPAR